MSRPPLEAPLPFPGQIDVREEAALVPSPPASRELVGDPRSHFEVTTRSSTSSVPTAAAAWKRRVNVGLTCVQVAAVVALSAVAGVVIYKTATSGSPDAQRLAVGLIGALLGILWSNFSKLIDTMSKD